MSERRPREERAELRAGLRLVTAAAGLVLLGVLAGPPVLLVHAEWSPLLALDRSVTASAEDLVDGTPLLTLARVLTTLGDPLLLTVGTLALVVVLLRAGRPRLAAFVVLCRAGAMLLSGTIKASVDRVRPEFQEPVASASGASFPSGHSLGAAAFWLAVAVVVLPLVAARWRGVVLIVAGATAAVVAATRVLLGVHYLSDVVVGVALGLGWTAVCTTLFALWRRDEGRSVDPVREGLEPELRA